MCCILRATMLLHKAVRNKGSRKICKMTSFGSRSINIMFQYCKKILIISQTMKTIHKLLHNRKKACTLQWQYNIIQVPFLLCAFYLKTSWMQILPSDMQDYLLTTCTWITSIFNCTSLVEKVHSTIKCD